MTTAEALEIIGQKLQAQYGKDALPSAELQRQTAALTGHQESSVIPSDFCYNRTNAGIPVANKPLFLYESRGWYRYVGTDYLYTGPIIHKPKGQSERVVGHRREGVVTTLQIVSWADRE